MPLFSGDADHGLRRLWAGLLGLAWLGVLAGLVPSGALGLVLFVAGPRLGGPLLSPLSLAKRGAALAGSGGLLDRIDSLLVALSAYLWT